MSVLDQFSLEGKVAIVTGASSGLGVAFAQALAEAGADVALGARRVDRCTAIAEDIGGAVGVDVRDTISRTGWESFEFTDVACAIAAAVAMVRLAVAVFGSDDDPPVPGSLLVTVLGAIAVALVAYRFANPPFVGLDREIGVWLGLLGAGLITYGGAVAMRSRH